MSEKIAQLMAELYQPQGDEAGGARALQSYLPRSIKRGEKSMKEVRERQNAATGLATSVPDIGGIPSAALGLISHEARDSWRDAQNSGGVGPKIIGSLPGIAAGIAGPLAMARAGARLPTVSGAGASYGAGQDVIDQVAGGDVDGITPRTAGSAIAGSVLGMPGFKSAVGAGAVGGDLASGGRATGRIMEGLQSAFGISPANAEPWTGGRVNAADPEQVRMFQEEMKKRGTYKGPIDGRADEGKQTWRLIDAHNVNYPPPPPPAPPPPPPRQRTPEEIEEDRLKVEGRRRSLNEETERRIRENTIGHDVRRGLEPYIGPGFAGATGRVVDTVRDFLPVVAGAYGGAKIRGAFGKSMNEAAAAENKAINEIGRDIINDPRTANPISTLSEAGQRYGRALGARDVAGQQATTRNIGSPSPQGVTSESPETIFSRTHGVDKFGYPAMAGVWAGSTYLGGKEKENFKEALKAYEKDPSRSNFILMENAQRAMDIYDAVKMADYGMIAGWTKGKFANAYRGRAGQTGDGAVNGPAISAIRGEETAGGIYAATRAGQTNAAGPVFGLPPGAAPKAAAQPAAAQPAAAQPAAQANAGVGGAPAPAVVLRGLGLSPAQRKAIHRRIKKP